MKKQGFVSQSVLNEMPVVDEKKAKKLIEGGHSIGLKSYVNQVQNLNSNDIKKIARAIAKEQGIPYEEAYNFAIPFYAKVKRIEKIKEWKLLSNVRTEAQSTNILRRMIEIFSN